MSVFVWFPKGKWQLADEKTDLYLFTILTNRDAQSQNMPQMIQNTVFYDASGHKGAVHEETPSRTT